MAKTDAERTRYNELIKEARAGTAIERAAYDWAVAYGRARKLKLPPKDANVVDAPATADLTPKPPKVAKGNGAAKAAAKPVAKGNSNKSTKVVNKGETCSADGCDRPARALGLCSKHHTKWYRDNVPGAREAAREAQRKYVEKKKAATAAR